MKKWTFIAAATLFAILAVADFIHDFITSDPVHYLAQQPDRLLWVAAIAIGGGLLTLVFCRLSPRLQRWVKLLALGAAASWLTALTGCVLLVCVGWSSQFGISNTPVSLIVGPVCLGVGAAFLWFGCYRVSKCRVI